MSYSTVDGIKAFVTNYDNLLKASDENGGFTATDVVESRADADNLIDTTLKNKGIPWSSLPLTNADDLKAVSGIANRLTACTLLQKAFLQATPNSSDWVNGKCDKAEKMLENIEASNLNAVGTSEDLPESNTRNQDRVFSIGTESDGAEKATGTMDKW